MGSRERLILIVLSLALAGGLVALVIVKGKEDEAGSESVGSMGPEGWSLMRVPSYGQPIREEELKSGIVVQTVGEGQGNPVPNGRPMDLHYRIFTLDGAQQGRGVLPGITLGAKNKLPDSFMEGLTGIKMFEKRRLLIPAERIEPVPATRIPAGRDIVFDLQPVELVIEDIIDGTGREAALNDKIQVHYHGTLENGAVFDSSLQRGEPIEFPLRVGQLIRGWTDGIPGMKVGGKRRLWVPFHLAYGARAAGPKVPPYSNLIFDVELLDIGRR